MMFIFYFVLWCFSFLNFMEFQFPVFHFTPLHYAVRNGDMKIVELLLDQPRIEVNCKTISCFKFLLY